MLGQKGTRIKMFRKWDH